MRNLITRIELAMMETALNAADPAEDYKAKRKALQDLQMLPSSSEPEIKQAIMQRLAALNKEAELLGVKEGGWDSGDISPTQPDGDIAVKNALRGKLQTPAQSNSPANRQKMISDLTTRAQAGDKGAAATLAAFKRSGVTK